MSSALAIAAVSAAPKDLLVIVDEVALPNASRNRATSLEAS